MLFASKLITVFILSMDAFGGIEVVRLVRTGGRISPAFTHRFTTKLGPATKQRKGNLSAHAWSGREGNHKPPVMFFRIA